jgi:hypothetical protein
MAIRPITRSPLLLLTLSICLTISSLAISIHILSVFREEHASNPWWLPIWHAHFNTHGLIASIVTSCIVIAVDVTSMGLVVVGNKRDKVLPSTMCKEAILTRIRTRWSSG